MATELVVIFRSQSDVEASIVRGLLEANGIMAVLSSRVTHSVFPVNVNELGEVRVAVPPGWLTRAFFALADNHGVTLRGLERDDESLEEMFHRVIEE